MNKLESSRLVRLLIFAAFGALSIYMMILEETENILTHEDIVNLMIAAERDIQIMETAESTYKNCSPYFLNLYQEIMINNPQLITESSESDHKKLVDTIFFNRLYRGLLFHFEPGYWQEVLTEAHKYIVLHATDKIKTDELIENALKCALSEVKNRHEFVIETFTSFN